LLEAMVYRYKGHSVSDPAKYRTKEELSQYQARDPIITLGEYLKKNKIATEDQLKTWDDEAKQKVKEAEEFADNSAIPDESVAFEDVYAE
jgi:pyruvate dehydrogenase E1 component alpha subunit